MVAKVFSISVPEYTIKSKPKYVSIGKKVDRVIEQNFPDGKYVFRAISSHDHKLTLDQLAKKIGELGTDKYDKRRKEVCHDEFSGYDHDFQAGMITIKKGKLIIPDDYKYKTEFGDCIWHFYEHTPLDRGNSVRIDLVILYDPKYLRKAKKVRDAPPLRRRLAQFLYTFKDKKKKKEALVGIVKITK